MFFAPHIQHVGARPTVQRNRLAWPHRRRGLASDGVRYADAQSSVGCRFRSVMKLRLGWYGGVSLLLQQRSTHPREMAIPPKASTSHFEFSSWLDLGRSGPNLEPGTMRDYVKNGPRNGLDSAGRVGPCPGSRRRWVLGSVHALSQAAHAANAYRTRFHVRARPSYVFRLVRNHRGGHFFKRALQLLINRYG